VPGDATLEAVLPTTSSVAIRLTYAASTSHWAAQTRVVMHKQVMTTSGVVKSTTK